MSLSISTPLVPKLEDATTPASANPSTVTASDEAALTLNDPLASTSTGTTSLKSNTTATSTGKRRKSKKVDAKVAEKVKVIEGKDKIIKAQRLTIKSYQEQLVGALQNTIRLQEHIVKFNEKEVKRLRREVRRLQGGRPNRNPVPGSGLNRWTLWGCD